MRLTLGATITTISRIGFLLLIVFASAAYGLTRPSTIQAFNAVACIVLGLWLLGCIVRWTPPRTGFLVPIIILGILAVGLTTTAAGMLYDRLLESDDDSLDWLLDASLTLSTFDTSLSQAAMIRTAVLLGLLLMSIDMFRSREWGQGILLTLLVTGFGIVILFLLQRIFGGPFLLRDYTNRHYLSFATFRYWGNGASYLNLIWPLAIAFALRTKVLGRPGWSLWTAAAILIYSATFINVSKAGQILAAFGAILMFATIGLIALQRKKIHFTVTGISISAVIAVALVTSFIFAIPYGRWEHTINRGVENNARLIAYPHFLSMLPDASWLGFGPGTFSSVYLQYFEGDERMKDLAFWVAHQDYIQTIVEWGYAGTVLWGILLLPGSCGLLVRSVRSDDYAPPRESGYAFGWRDHIVQWFSALPEAGDPLCLFGGFIAVLLTALHAMIDFPMQIESLQFYFLIWIGLGWSVLRKKTRKTPAAG